MNVNLNKNRRHAAQAMIEFALVFPILLLLIYGIIEFGRLIFIYSAVTTASREASRFGSAAGPSDTGIPRYLDEAGMRLAARRSLIAVPVPDEDINIRYDCGPATTQSTDFQDCTSTQAARVLIQVDATYEPIFNNMLFEIPIIPITAAASRTIMREIAIEGTPQPVSNGMPFVFFSAANQSSPENSGVVNVELRLTAATNSPVVVTVDVSASALDGTDYTIGTLPVTFPANTTTRFIPITIIDDQLPEYAEFITLTITQAQGAEIGAPRAFTLTIEDNDPWPYVVFTTQTASIGEAGGGVLVNVALNSKDDGSGSPVPVGGDVVVNFTADGSAVLGSDYTLPAASITIPEGFTSALYSILIVNDSSDPIDEEDENVRLTVNGVVGLARADGTTSYNLTIIDDDTSLISWETNEFSIGEKSGPVKLRITMAPRSDRDVQVVFNRGGTATNNTDYTLTASPVIIGSLTMAYDLTLTPIEDSVANEGEYITLTLEDPANADIGTYKTLKINLEDGNVSQPISIKPISPTVFNEGQTVPITFVAGGPVAEDVTVNITLGGTASYTGTVGYVAGHIDYTLPSLSVKIPKGATSATTNITLASDDVDEANETVSITIGSVSSLNNLATIGTPSSQAFTIADVTITPVVSFMETTRKYNEGSGRAEIPISISPRSSQDINLSFYYAITSTASSDPTSLFYAYDVLTTTITVPAYTSVITLPVGLPSNFFVDQPERVLYIQINPITPSTLAHRDFPYQFEMRIAEVDVCATAGSIAPFDDNQKKITINVLNATTNNRPLVLSGVQLYETTGQLPNNQTWNAITYSSLGTFTLPTTQFLNMSSPFYNIAPPGIIYSLPQNGSVTIIFTLSKNLGLNTRYVARLIFQDATKGSTFTCPLTITEP